MRRLRLVILLLVTAACAFSQSPHGPGLKANCADCHSSFSWEIDADTLSFNHDTTAFPLAGRHARVDCRDCHQTLVFPEASPECISCHTDIHRTTVGSDCARCHTPDNWLVDNITELHQENGFPLLGAHAALGCNDCHVSESALEFNRIGNDCVSCHLDDFNATTNPNHQDAGFSINCAECHSIEGTDWSSGNVDHSFFPLTKGHEVGDCARCHTGGDFAGTPTDCFACHQPDYDNSLDPNHPAAGLPVSCAECHTTDVGWMPAEYSQHDALFPIYSGEHEGQWASCSDCHDNPSNYAEFRCINCHINPETDDGHAGVSGYDYENTACLACHPAGSTDGAFDHNSTNFPLTGAHLATDCILCHADGYAGTPTECEACHTEDFNNSANPNHQVLGLPTDCAACHTTEPGWSPATFDIHNDFYPLNGAHADISTDCAACHNGDYNNTPNTCAGCHIGDYNQTTAPDHQAGQFPVDCESCHTETAWVPSTLDHSSFYPLTGAHAAIADDCAACHSAGYDNTPNECAGCHTPDYDQSANPNHLALGLPTDCESCHTTAPDWMPASFAIHNDFYPLNGAHAAIANDCAACHNGDYNNTPNTCFGCHASDYNQAIDPNHAAAQFPVDCQSCHSESQWVPATFDHDGQYFPIYSGKHDGEWNECTDCHTNPSNYAEFTCISCHVNPETDEEHEGVGGYVYENSACLACHPTGDADAVFDHNATAFPLTGAHIAAQCLDCHAAGYAGTSTECASCHTNDFNQTANPNHNALGLSTDCASCHTTDPGWRPAAFDIHNDFHPLNGAHATIANDCAGCHNGDYNNTPNTCAGCHTGDYNQTTAPDHQAAQFPTDCQDCHTETTWAPSTFDHNSFYPLTGGHAVVADDCVGCHNGDYENTPNECAGCHTPNYNQSANPNHPALGLPTDCESCHTTAPDWMPASFAIHDDYYALNGAHAAIANDCAACHNGDYNNTPNTCFGCHASDYNQAVDPNHAAAQFPTDCQSCHTESQWVPATFDHDGQYFPIYSGKHDGEWNECAECHTNPSNYAEFSCINCHTNPDTDDEHDGVGGYVYENTACLACHPAGDADAVFDHNATAFPLTGAHTAAECLDCHAAGFAGTSSECASCHTNDFNQTANPSHSALGFSNDCASCHTTDPGWSPAAFDNHNDFYALNGAHAAASNDCAGCHNGDYNNTPNDCAGCHTDNYNQTTDPDHQAAQFPTDCQDCHTESAWAPSTFDHNAFYPFAGAHAAIADDCAACHNGDYDNTPNDCAGCHTGDYNQTTNPDHQAAQFPADCQSCHTESAWAPSTFDHNSFYPLTGAHATVADDCVACHNGDYANTPNECAGCHTPDYNQSANPNHQALGLPTDCGSCHTTAPDWMPAAFDIHDNYYALNGAHAAISSDCAACHNGDYANTPNECFGCHASDYNNTTDPNHAALQFSTDCQSCHTESEWIPSTFDHDGLYFPIYSGRHDGEWSECLDCHTVLSDYTQVSCTNCHVNPQTDDEHAGVTGYVYESTACLACHPTGDASVIFDHNATAFPLTGAHTAADCLDCHASGYAGTSTECASCHTPDFNQTANPSHTALGFSTDCASCHTTDPGWSPAAFDNHNDYYALNGAHAAVSNDCASCHNGDYNNTPNDCAGCHTDNYNQTTNPDHQAAQFPTDCQGCHTETAWAPSIFDHNSFYPLTGAHAAVADDCAGCHNGDYANTPNTCAGCHTPDYNQSLNPNHQALGLPTDCESCHTTAPDWMPATFAIHDNYFALNGAHAVVADDCAACHSGDYANTPNTCFGCHAGDYNQTASPDHAAAQFPTDCQDCHTETAWAPSTFDHNSFYPIIGAHVAVANDCAACHNGNYASTPNTCDGCHMDDYNQTASPNHAAAQFPTDCQDCHTETAWAPSTFDHNSFYPFTGAHVAVADDCAACHNGDYANTPNTCAGCHTPDYNQSLNPNHQALGLPTDCESCHTTAPDWMPATFAIHDNYYALNGAHAVVADDCAACHNGGYNNTPNTCFGCHAGDYSQTANPNHAAAQFPTDCQDCHTETAWAPSTFDHNSFYPITGAHVAVANDCAACHNGNYASTPNTCDGCHIDDYNQTASPNHAAAQFPTDCQDCHTETAWSPSTFDHNSFYPFTGAHMAVADDCAACHNGDYANTPNTCAGCHTPDYNQSANPNHQALGLPTDCESCHTTAPDWMPATFAIHDNYYALNGAHAVVADDCAACHNGDYTNTPNTCFGCHAGDYNQTASPNHAAAQFPTDCQDCHTETAWAPSTFDHNSFYPIIGAHVAVANDCAACHNGDYVNTPNTCDGCHTDDYNQTASPNHAAAQFPTDCQDCHTETAWAPSSFDHNSFYPFTGAHIAVANDCAACHNGNYTNTPNTCFGCHAAAYNQTANPNHAAAQFPTDCQECHSETAWIPSSFDHNSIYPIVGAHLAVANNCNACHNGDYNNTPNTCNGCHMSDYNQTTNPNHAAAQFPTDCQSCHGQTAWQPATFNHDGMYFPIYSGKHEGEWNNCTDCHTIAGNFSAFSCIDCHEHDDPVELLDKHDDAPGYVYQSNACYACHPTGEKD